MIYPQRLQGSTLSIKVDRICLLVSQFISIPWVRHLQRLSSASIRNPFSSCITSISNYYLKRCRHIAYDTMTAKIVKSQYKIETGSELAFWDLDFHRIHLKLENRKIVYSSRFGNDSRAQIKLIKRCKVACHFTAPDRTCKSQILSGWVKGLLVSAVSSSVSHEIIIESAQRMNLCLRERDIGPRSAPTVFFAVG